MTARPLSKVYAGVLSRNWPKLIEATGRGEGRAVVYKYNYSEETDGWFNAEIDRVSLIFKAKPTSPVWTVTGMRHDLYQLTGDNHPSGWKVTKEFITRDEDDFDWWLENKCLGFFPASDDEK